jgi:hypothetical protein
MDVTLCRHDIDEVEDEAESNWSDASSSCEDLARPDRRGPCITARTEITDRFARSMSASRSLFDFANKSKGNSTRLAKQHFT